MLLNQMQSTHIKLISICLGEKAHSWWC